jgi:hypothetical protein
VLVHERDERLGERFGPLRTPEVHVWMIVDL